MVLQSCGQQIVKRQDMIEDGQRRLLASQYLCHPANLAALWAIRVLCSQSICNSASPSRTSLLKRDWLLRLLYEFLKTRIAAQRVPEWMQTQLTVRKQTIVGQQVFQLSKCKILFASPSVDDCEICKHRATRHRVFCNGQ